MEWLHSAHLIFSEYIKSLLHHLDLEEERVEYARERERERDVSVSFGCIHWKTNFLTKPFCYTSRLKDKSLAYINTHHLWKSLERNAPSQMRGIWLICYLNKSFWIKEEKQAGSKGEWEQVVVLNADQYITWRPLLRWNSIRLKQSQENQGCCKKWLWCVPVNSIMVESWHESGGLNCSRLSLEFICMHDLFTNRIHTFTKT